MKKNYMLINGRVKKIKPEITLQHMKDKYPDIKIEKCKTPPSEQTIKRWDNEGYCRTTDGCKVEPDGICSHGHESWLLVLGYI